MGKQHEEEQAVPKPFGDAKGKATFDQNGEGNAPKYGQSGEEPNENGALEDQAFNSDKSKKED